MLYPLSYEGAAGSVARLARALRSDWALTLAGTAVLMLVLIAALAPAIVDVLGVPGPGARTAGTLTTLGAPTGPSAAHPFGVDELGRDVLARVIYGVRSSLEVAALGTVIAAVLGTAVGLVARASIRLIDAMLMLLADALLAIPAVLLGLAIAGACGGEDCAAGVVESGFGVVVLVIAVSSGARVARFVRARAGSPGFTRALMGHATLLVAVNIVLEAGLSFLGAGLHGTDVSLGQMLSGAGTEVLAGEKTWWYLVFPGVALALSVLAFSVFARRIAPGTEISSPTERRASVSGSVVRGAASLILITVATFVVFRVLPGAGPHPGTLWDLFRLKLGVSHRSGHSVLSTVVDRLPGTLSVAGGAVVVGALVALLTALIAAMNRSRALGRAAMAAAAAALSAPVFWLALGGVYLFATNVGVAPVFDGPGSYAGLTSSPSRWFGSLVLPWLVLAVPFVAFYAPIVRSQLERAMSARYIVTARAKGVGERHVLLRHALRATLPHLLAVLAAEGAALLSAVVLVEVVFNVPGIGRLAYDSLRSGDLPVLRGALLFGAFLVVVYRLLVEILNWIADPSARRR